MIAFLRPTESAGLLVQMAGRGTRTVYAAGMPLDTAEQRLAAIAASDKKNCLILDFAGNLDRHGPLDMIKAKAKGAGGGVPPMKVCQNIVSFSDVGDTALVGNGMICGTILHISKMICPACGFNFPPPEKETIAPKAANVKVLSSQVITEVFDVTEVTYREHQGKDGKPNTLCVQYQCGMFFHIKEWVCLNHPAGSWARNKAREWWNERKTIHDMPASVTAALEPANLGGVQFRPVDGLTRPLQIEAEKQGNFWRIVRYIYEQEESAQAPSTAPTYQRSSIDTDDIPF
jgi:DNA repair protein RadD